MLHKQTGKLIACIAENLPFMGTDVMQRWIENPKDLHAALHKALCPSWTAEFPTWRTLKLGTGLKTAGDFRVALKIAGFDISERAGVILSKPAFIFPVSGEETEVELVIVSVAELGFECDATRKCIYDRAEKLDLCLCPAEVGPQLCLQYKDQPKNEMLLIAMEPIYDSAGRLCIFDVERSVGGKRLLSDNRGQPGIVWNANHLWVFVRRKQPHP
jgi:hypothetical protein